MRQPKNHWQAVWTAWKFLENHAARGRNGCFPAELAKASGMTRLEAELALRLCREQDMAIFRSDGRYFFRKPKEAQP